MGTWQSLLSRPRFAAARDQRQRTAPGMATSLGRFQQWGVEDLEIDGLLVSNIWNRWFLEWVAHNFRWKRIWQNPKLFGRFWYSITPTERYEPFGVITSNRGYIQDVWNQLPNKEPIKWTIEQHTSHYPRHIEQWTMEPPIFPMGFPMGFPMVYLWIIQNHQFHWGAQLPTKMAMNRMADGCVIAPEGGKDSRMGLVSVAGPVCLPLPQIYRIIH